MNEHIKANRIDIYTAEEYGIQKYDEMVKFSRWLENQPVRFTTPVHALRTYRGLEVEETTEPPAPRYTEKSFKSRQQLNSFLRENGYTWHKVAPMNEDEESYYGESFRWQLYKGSRAVSVQEALSEIG